MNLNPQKAKFQIYSLLPEMVSWEVIAVTLPVRASEGTAPLCVQRWGGLGREPWMLVKTLALVQETGHTLLDTKIGIERDGSGARL